MSALKYGAPEHLDQQASLGILAKQVDRFLTLKYQTLFDCCVIVQGNRSDATPLMLQVARELCNLGRVRTFERLGKTGHVTVMKRVERSARAQAIAGRYKLMKDSAVPDGSRILVLDDIYDSGATLSEAVATVRRSAPQAHVVALTAAYLRDPKEHE